MERILVSMDSRQWMATEPGPAADTVENGFIGAVSRAAHLAERIMASVHILLVTDDDEDRGFKAAETLFTREGALRRRLESMLENERSDGVRLNYYIANGEYEEEVIRFAKEYKITMLVLGQPDATGDCAPARAFEKSLRKLRQGVDCTIELVQRKDAAAGSRKADVSGG